MKGQLARNILLLTTTLTVGCIPGEKGELKYSVKRLEVQQSSEVDLQRVEATYQNVRNLIFEEKCIGCHKQGRAKSGVDLSQYESVFDWSDYFQPIVTKGDPDQSGVYTEVARGAMPPPKRSEPLSSEEIEFIKRWILEGAKP